MKRIATSIEESKRLLGFGIDPNTADMCWGRARGTKTWLLFTNNAKSGGYWDVIPAWSLGKLFDIAWELDPNQVLSFQKGEKMDLIAIMVDFIEMLVREVNTKGKEE